MNAPANPLPPLTPEEYAALKDSIRDRGVLVPAVVSAGPACEGEVGDGHHRLKACGELAIECPVERQPFATEAEFRLYQLDCNVQRRQLSVAQKIELGMAREPWERMLAEQRMKAGKPGPSGSPTGGSGSGESRERTAAAVGLKPSTYERGAKVLREAPPELADKLRAGETTVNRAYLELRNQQKRDEAREKADRLPDPDAPEGTYRCIVIDPPWPMAKIAREQRPDQGEQLDYPTMSLDEIRTLTVADLVDPAGCHVYLWVTHKFLPAGLELLEEWGCRYECSLTWVKPSGITPYSWMYNTEHCLFARAGGKLALARMGRKLALQAPAGRHSAKPDAFYELVAECSPGPRLELFAREPRPGFAAWEMRLPVRPDVAHDFAWGRQFLPEVRSILGRYLIAEAPFDEDAQRATDLIVLRLEAVRIAVRIRRAEHEASYGGEFTLRASRPSGAETELAKVIAGWGDYMFYGFGGDDGRLGAWVLGDLRVFRLWHASQMMRLPERQFPGKALPNRDGSSTFHAFRIDDLPSSFAVARKHARQRAAA